MSGVKRVTLTIQQRMEVLKDLETTSIHQVAAKYNVNAKTIRRIKNNAASISRVAENKDQRKRRRMKRPLYPELEQQLYAWFVERRLLGDHLTDALLLQKANELMENMPSKSTSQLTMGWLVKFKRRNNIRLVRLYGEKASADEDAAHRFFTHFLASCNEKERRRSGEVQVKNEDRNESGDQGRNENEDEGRDENENEGSNEYKDGGRNENENEGSNENKDGGRNENEDEFTGHNRVQDGDKDENEDEDEDEDGDEGGDGDKGGDEGGDRNEDEDGDGAPVSQVRGIPLNAEEREELENCFKTIEKYDDRASYALRMQTQVLKLYYLGDKPIYDRPIRRRQDN